QEARRRHPAKPRDHVGVAILAERAVQRPERDPPDREAESEAEEPAGKGGRWHGSSLSPMAGTPANGARHGATRDQNCAVEGDADCLNSHMPIPKPATTKPVAHAQA